MNFYIACEDQLAQACCCKIIKSYLPHCTFGSPIITGGCGTLRKKIDPFIKLSYNAQIATLILADLDLHKDSEHLKNIWMNGRKITNRFLLIVAVREIESWLLADSDSFEKWSSVPKNKIVSNPDSIQDVKQNLLNLISKYAKSEIQRDLLPSKGNLTSKVGIAYNSRLVNYIDNYWDPEIARHRSNSLDYALKELEDFKKEYP